MLTPVLQIVRRVISRFLLKQAGVQADETDSCAVTLVQRFGFAASRNIHLRVLVLDGVFRRSTDGELEFVEVPAPTDEALQMVLHMIITCTMKLLTRRGVGRRGGFDLQGRQRRRFGIVPRAQAAAGCGAYLPHRFRPARRPEGADTARFNAQRE